jgi:hypothetical protein
MTAGYTLESASTHPVKEVQCRWITSIAMEVHAKKLTSQPIILSTVGNIWKNHLAKIVDKDPAWKDSAAKISKPERQSADAAEQGVMSNKQIWDRWKTVIKPGVQLHMRACASVFPNGKPSGMTHMSERDHWDPMRDYVWAACKAAALKAAAMKKHKDALARGEDSILEVPPTPSRPDGWRHLCEGTYKAWGNPLGEPHIAFLDDDGPAGRRAPLQKNQTTAEVQRGSGAFSRDKQRAKELLANADWIDPQVAMLQCSQSMARQGKRDSKWLEYATERDMREKKFNRLSQMLRDEDEQEEKAKIKAEIRKLREEPSPQKPVFTPSPVFDKRKYQKRTSTPASVPTFASDTNNTCSANDDDTGAPQPAAAEVRPGDERLEDDEDIEGTEDQ